MIFASSKESTLNNLHGISEFQKGIFRESKFENTNDLHHFKEQSTDTHENDVKKMVYICVDR